MRMARINIYLPDDLAESAKKSDLNISGLAREAIRSALAARELDKWLASVLELEPTAASHDEVVEAVAAARAELEDV